METRHINYKSDFKFRLVVRDIRGKEIDLTKYDWQAYFRTSMDSQSICAGIVKGVPCGCVIRPEGVIIVAQNHGLPPGKLRCELEIMIPDEDFDEDGAGIVTPDPLDIELVEGKGDDSNELFSTEAELSLPMLKGDKGDPFTFEDFTEEQIEMLRGPQGPQGPQGIKGERGEQGSKGEAFTYEDFTPDQISLLQKPALDVASEIAQAETRRVEAEKARQEAEAVREDKSRYSMINLNFGEDSTLAEFFNFDSGVIITDVKTENVSECNIATGSEVAPIAPGLIIKEGAKVVLEIKRITNNAVAVVGIKTKVI